MTAQSCIVCGNLADMDSPADLCEQHWEDWFDFAIEVDEDAKPGEQHRRNELLSALLSAWPKSSSETENRS